MTTTINEILQFIEEDDVKFVRLSFCDPFGFQKNISILSSELSDAFAHGISFDASSVNGFKDVTESDLVLFPDPATLTIMPWRPDPGRVIRFYCDIKHPDGTPFLHDGRHLLKKVLKRCEDMGYRCNIGTECEFYLFLTDENGNPTDQTLDYGSYMDIAPLDKGENIRREICLCLEEMGLEPKASYHEKGPGQNEIDFKHSDGLRAADNLLTFKSVVRAIASRNGLYASFMPKPLVNKSGSGMHLNLSLLKNGKNIFKSGGYEHCQEAESFMAGVLEKAAEMTLFLNPNINSYQRLGGFLAPRYVSWSHQNRSQLVRIPAAVNGKVRMELRSPDPSVNPYLAFALVIEAGLQGIEKGLKLPESTDLDLYQAPAEITEKLTRLPEDLESAMTVAKGSAFVTTLIGQKLLDQYTAILTEELTLYKNCEDKAQFITDRYFKYL